jgi:hypothetical protein
MRKGFVGFIAVAAMVFATATFASDWGTDTTAVYKRDQFTLNLGAMFASFGTTANLDSGYYGNGTNLDFQRDFGLQNNQALWRLDGSWRFTPRQQLYFSYVSMNQDGSKNLSRNVQWGNEIYYVGANVKGTWDTWQANLYYRFSFVQGDKGEFGGTIGVSYADITASLQGQGQVAGTTALYYGKVEGHVAAPVPVIGLFGTWQINPQWSLFADVNYLQLNISGVDGRYTDARVNVDYFPWKNYGFGAGYLYDDYKIDSTKNSFAGSLDYRFSGWLAYFKVRF